MIPKRGESESGPPDGPLVGRPPDRCELSVQRREMRSPATAGICRQARVGPIRYDAALMREFKLRNDLKRSVVGSYALPLGIEAVDLDPPTQGYTVKFTTGEEDEPDGYSFHAVLSHERMRSLVRDAFELLPEEIVPIIEIGSRDAYRSVDVYLADEPLPRERFLEVWEAIEPIVLEDASIGIGANSEEPWIEVFLDSWKGLTIHVDVERRDEVERLLRRHGLQEVAETWPEVEESDLEPSTRSREVLELIDDQSPDIDELLLSLRDMWGMELNIDPETNIDEGGRELGMTLWQALVLADAADGNEDRGAYISIWAAASSINEMEMFVDLVMEDQEEWVFNSIYSIDRVAYDERPDALASLPPRPREAKVHLVEIDAWGDAPTPDPGPEAHG